MTIFGKILSGAISFAKSLFNVTTVAPAQAVASGTATEPAVPVAPPAGAITQPETVLETDAQFAIDLVNNIKAALTSPVAILITAIIPGTVDDVIRETLVNDLPQLAAGLTFFKGILQSSDKSTQFNQVLAAVKFSDKPNLDALWHTMAAKVLMIKSGGTVSWSNALIAIEYYFTHLLNAPAPVISVEAPQVEPDLTSAVTNS